MHCIQFRKEMADLFCKEGGCQMRQNVWMTEFREDAIQLRYDVFGVAEPVAIFPYADGPDFSGPCIDILEKVPVQREVVFDTEVAVRKLFCPEEEESEFCLVEQSGVGNIEQIY